ncbi:SdiA-regulated domain-containing protein [Azotobacter salinestris]|uniref:SdiA-regulated domain-containing protein n=1 Tax=Azotobacter salinestris TaxID=69964 RepID=UPI0032E05204
MSAIIKGLLGSTRLWAGKRLLRGRKLLGRRPVARLWIWGLSFLGLALAYQVRAEHLDERLYFWLKTSWQAERWEGHSLWLPDYRVRIEAMPIPGMHHNLSGLTYDDERHHLWAVLNNPEELIALSIAGEVLARYPLEGFRDVEGVAYLGDGLLLFTEERDQALVAVPIPQQSGALRREDYRALTLGLGNDDDENRGFEGVAYDRAGDRLFVVKEHSPRKLYEIRGFKASLSGDFNLEVIDHDAWLRRKNLASDLSSVEYDRSNGHLVLLSDEARLMLELDGKGKMVSFRSLRGGFAGLKKSVPQGEGIALDERGNLYVVSEPNLFYVFKRKD